MAERRGLIVKMSFFVSESIMEAPKYYRYFNVRDLPQNNIRREAKKHFRNKKSEYLKDKIDELATNSKNKNIRELYRGINKFKRGYQPRSGARIA
jgi:hypothetical protein